MVTSKNEMDRELPVRNPRTGENDCVIYPPGNAELESIVAGLRSNQTEWANLDIGHRCSVVTAWVDDLLDPAKGVFGELLNALATDTGRYLLAMVEVQSIRNIVSGWAHQAVCH